MAFLLQIPDELLLKILLLLDSEFLLNVAAILNHRFYYLTRDSSLWATFKPPVYWKLSNLLSFMKNVKAFSNVRCLDVSLLAASSVNPRRTEAEFTWIDLQRGLQPCCQVRELHLGNAGAVGCMRCIPHVFPKVEEIYIHFVSDDEALLANLNWLKKEKPGVKIHLIDGSLEVLASDLAGSKSSLLIETVSDLIRVVDSGTTVPVQMVSFILRKGSYPAVIFQQTLLNACKKLGSLIAHLDIDSITPMQAFNIIPQACPNVKRYGISYLQHGKNKTEKFTFTSMKNLLVLKLSGRIFPIIDLQDFQKVLDICPVLTRLIIGPKNVFTFESVPLSIVLPRSLQVFSLKYSQVHERNEILSGKLLQATLLCPSLREINTDSDAAFKLLANISFPGAWRNLSSLFLQNIGTPGGSETLRVLRGLSDCHAPLRFLGIHHEIEGTKRREIIEVLRTFHQLETLILNITFVVDFSPSDWRDIQLHVPGLCKLSFNICGAPHDNLSRIECWTAVVSALAEFCSLHTLDVSITKVDDAEDREAAKGQLLQVIKKLHGKWLTKSHPEGYRFGIIAYMCPGTCRVID